MTFAPSLAPTCTSDHCITCGDDGVAMTVISLEAGQGLAVCEDAEGERTTVEVTLVEPVDPGQQLLVHAGVALVALQAAHA